MKRSTTRSSTISKLTTRVRALRIIWTAIVVGSFMVPTVQRGMAEQVSAETAAAAAEGWLTQNPSPLRERLGRMIRKVEAFKNDQGEVVYYVADLKPSGFIILPADDLLEPIIAFAARGRFDPSPVHPLGALVNDDIPRRVARVRASVSTTGLLEAKGKWKMLQQHPLSGSDPGSMQRLAILRLSDLRVAPLVQNLWNQDTAENGAACYNYYTPPYAAGSPSNFYCGCVATAMAQLMAYFQWPQQGVGTNAFTISVNSVKRSARLRGGDGMGGQYAWASMPANPTSPTVAECQAIGALTYDAGVAAKMDYAQDSSRAYCSNARLALVTTFKFRQAIMASSSSDTASLGQGLLSMVNPNLDAGLPVFLSIYGPPGGHAIICDGYGYHFATLYHHLNVGWGGLGNAWYALPTIDAAGELFTNINTCVYNIFVTGTGEIISGRVLDTNSLPIAGATVSAIRTGGGAYSATTDSCGIYALAGVPSASQYAVSAACPGYSPSLRRYSTGTSTSGTLKCGNVWSANFTLVPTNALPQITLQPHDQSAVRGATVCFAGVATGAAPLSYHWQKDGQRLDSVGNISGSASTSLVISNVSAADVATYSLVASNAYGSATSTGAVLTLYAPALPMEITFDDLTNATDQSLMPAGYAGLNWVNFDWLDAVNTAARPSGYQVGMVSSNVVAFNRFGQPASLSSTGLFSLISAYSTAAWNDNLRLQVEGYVGGTMTHSNCYALSATARTFIQFNFLGVQEVHFISWGGTLHPGYTHAEPAEQFVLDNVTVATGLQPISPPVLQTTTAHSGTVLLSWAAAPGQWYQVQYTTDLAQRKWNNLGGALLATNSISACSDITATNHQRFYRVVLLP